jgi:5-methylcytosine-specific restriction endonuclease McrA
MNDDELLRWLNEFWDEDIPHWLMDKDWEPALFKEVDAWINDLGPSWLVGYHRREQLRLNGGSHTNAEWRTLCASYGHRCLCCKRGRKLTKDHILPVALGGSDDISNIQPLCQSCNSSKGARHIDYRPKEAQSRGLLP